MSINFVKKENGVTMIELLIAMSLFAIFMTIAIGGFVQAIRNQRLALKLMSATDNMAIPLEQMMREIRVANNFISTQNSLMFDKVENASSGALKEYEVMYYYDKSLKAIMRKKTLLVDGIPTGTSIDERFVSEGVEVDDFKIITNKIGAGPERITIIVAVSAVDRGKKITNHIQTTISSRIF